jgi:hypothetical protein
MNRYDIDRKLTVSVDPGHIIGEIKPLHGVNNAPYYFGGTDNIRFLKEANIPFSRLHDTCGPYGGNRFVDVANIFRDFDADETLPENYDFAATDHLVLGLHQYGVEAFYRLGCTIENDPYGVAFRIFPPADPEKWARICEHIIMHYNYGWAGGYKLGLRYWEIWNEPDNMPEIDENPMWRGTMEQFFELYRVAANHLKNRFPELMIGGYASCGFYSVVEKEASPEAHISPRTAYFTEFFLKFMEYIAADATKAPLDFFSWHSYADENSCVRFAEFARETLDRYGFTKTENIFNEWNTGTRLRGTVQDASNVASMMITMHPSPVDKMMYYDAQYIHSYSGLFSSDTHLPLKAYYSFKAYGELYSDGQQVSVRSTSDAVKVLASSHRLFIVNRLPEPVYVTVEARDNEGRSVTGSLRITDGAHDLSPVNWDGAHVPLAPYASALIELKKEDQYGSRD